MYAKTVLNNKLRILTYHMPNRVSVSLGVWIKAGSRYEALKLNGISHFLEHLLFKGTAKRSCEELKQAIEGLGGSLNAFTSEELTCFLAKVPEKYFTLALDVLSDMVLNARLEPKDIETERRVILEEIRMYKDLPAHFVMELLTKLLWPKQPLGMNIAGEKENITAISREDLLRYKQEFYRLDNIVVVACGSLQHKRIVQECQNLLASLPAVKIQTFLPAKQKQTHPRLTCYSKNIEQTHLALGLYALARNHPERFCLGLLHIILGANMSSRLFSKVREERGLAYEIGTMVKFYQDTGAFIVHAGIDNRRAVEAVEVILEQLAKIKKDQVDPAELNRAKEYYIGQMLLALEDTFEHMLWLGENFLSLNKALHPQEIIQRIKKVEADDLQRLANKILQNHNLNLALIGPLMDKDKQQIEKRLTV